MADPETPTEKQKSCIEDLSAQLLGNGSLMSTIARRFSHRDTFESRIRGSSMSPAIPGETKIRCQFVEISTLRSGDIIFFLSHNGFVVHRIIKRMMRHGQGAFLTAGDNCLIPDLPVPCERVIGKVVAYETGEHWRAPAALQFHSSGQRLLRSMTELIAVGCDVLGPSAATKVIKIQIWINEKSRGLVGRLLRRAQIVPRA